MCLSLLPAVDINLSLDFVLVFHLAHFIKT